MKIKLKDVVILAMLAALMCVGDFAMEWLPNVHFVGVLIVVATVVYRWYALFPIYVYVFIQGVVAGFHPWWVAYIYIWAVLWLFVMLIPQKLPEKIKNILYIAVCAAHGFLYGTLYAPSQVLLFFGGDFSKMIPWIIAGIPFDITHGVSNLICSVLLIYPIVKILKHTDKYTK